MNAEGMAIRLTIVLVRVGRTARFKTPGAACNDRNVSGLPAVGTPAVLLSGQDEKGRPPPCVRPNLCDHS
jgi:hypothetical protein